MVMMEPIQLSDDRELLELMLEDFAQAPAEYRPTNWWSGYTRQMVGDLRKWGLHDLRRSGRYPLSIISYDKYPPVPRIDLFYERLLARRLILNRFTRKLPFWSRTWESFNRLLTKLFPIVPPPQYRIDGLNEMSLEFIRMLGERAGARPIDDLIPSLAGNPEPYLTLGDTIFPWSILHFYLRYVYCCNYMDFDSTNVIVELGGGMGRQVEIIKKLHPKTSFILFDLVPQIYVCERYLSTVFPESVVSYRETRDMDALPESLEGKIYMFSTLKFPLLRNLKIDLFWNEASFQEMEPEVVANYLELVNSQSDAVYLEEIMEGSELGKSGRAGSVLEPTTLRHYKDGLSNFDLIDLSPCWAPLGRRNGPNDHTESFWKRAR